LIRSRLTAGQEAPGQLLSHLVVVRQSDRTHTHTVPNRPAGINFKTGGIRRVVSIQLCLNSFRGIQQRQRSPSAWLQWGRIPRANGMDAGVDEVANVACSESGVPVAADCGYPPVGHADLVPSAFSGGNDVCVVVADSAPNGKILSRNRQPGVLRPSRGAHVCGARSATGQHHRSFRWRSRPSVPTSAVRRRILG
jgi:hypothetical protein